MRPCGRAGVSLGFLVLSLTGLAEAHTSLKMSLKTSFPAAGTTLAGTPTEIRLQFHDRGMSADSPKVKGRFTFQVRP